MERPHLVQNWLWPPLPAAAQIPIVGLNGCMKGVYGHITGCVPVHLHVRLSVLTCVSWCACLCVCANKGLRNSAQRSIKPEDVRGESKERMRESERTWDVRNTRLNLKPSRLLTSIAIVITVISSVVNMVHVGIIHRLYCSFDVCRY